MTIKAVQPSAPSFIGSAVTTALSYTASAWSCFTSCFYTSTATTPPLKPESVTPISAPAAKVAPSASEPFPEVVKPNIKAPLQEIKAIQKELKGKLEKVKKLTEQYKDISVQNPYKKGFKVVNGQVVRLSWFERNIYCSAATFTLNEVHYFITKNIVDLTKEVNATLYTHTNHENKKVQEAVKAYATAVSNLMQYPRQIIESLHTHEIKIVQDWDDTTFPCEFHSVTLKRINYSQVLAYSAFNRAERLIAAAKKKEKSFWPSFKACREAMRWIKAFKGSGAIENSDITHKELGFAVAAFITDFSGASTEQLEQSKLLENIVGLMDLCKGVL